LRTGKKKKDAAARTRGGILEIQTRKRKGKEKLQRGGEKKKGATGRTMEDRGRGSEKKRPARWGWDTVSETTSRRGRAAFGHEPIPNSEQPKRKKKKGIVDPKVGRGFLERKKTNKGDKKTIGGKREVRTAKGERVEKKGK